MNQLYDNLSLRTQNAELSTAVVEIDVQPSLASSSEWDAFAHACCASFRCGFTATYIWQLEHHIFSTLERLDLVLHIDGGPIKVAQCAVGRGRKTAVFSDSIQILPAFEDYWPQCLRAVLTYLGPGHYRYGSEWTVAPCRAAALSGIVGVFDVQARYMDVQAIDFSRWSSWEDYLKSTSKNARRNVKKAELHYQDAQLREQREQRVFLDLISLQLFRHRLFLRKNVKSSVLALVVRSALRTIATSQYSFSIRLLHGSKTVARYLGIEFGENSFYLESAAKNGHSQVSSYLLREMIARAFERCRGNGKFVMGSNDYEQQGVPAWDGLIRSRRQWSATDFRTSVVSFSFSPSPESANDRLRPS